MNNDSKVAASLMHKLRGEFAIDRTKCVFVESQKKVLTAAEELKILVGEQT